MEVVNEVDTDDEEGEGGVDADEDLLDENDLTVRSAPGERTLSGRAVTGKGIGGIDFGDNVPDTAEKESVNPDDESSEGGAPRAVGKVRHTQPAGSGAMSAGDTGIFSSPGGRTKFGYDSPSKADMVRGRASSVDRHSDLKHHLKHHSHHGQHVIHAHAMTFGHGHAQVKKLQGLRKAKKGNMKKSIIVHQKDAASKDGQHQGRPGSAAGSHRTLTNNFESPAPGNASLSRKINYYIAHGIFDPGSSQNRSVFVVSAA